MIENFKFLCKWFDKPLKELLPVPSYHLLIPSKNSNAMTLQFTDISKSLIRTKIPKRSNKI